MFIFILNLFLARNGVDKKKERGRLRNTGVHDHLKKKQ